MNIKNEKNPVRCAVIGIGTMGKKYAAMIGGGEIDGLCLAAVCCRSDANAAWASANLPETVKICRSEDALYEEEDLFDAAIIVTPHKLHPAMAIRALNAGKHVLCDKPAGVTAGDAEMISQAAARSGKIYAMMCHQRTYPQHVKVKELLDSGVIGKVRRACLENSESFRTHFYHRSSTWRSSWTGEGGGMLINQGYHLMDFWQDLFGLPETLYADIPFGKYNDFNVDDEATLVMDYPGRMTGTFIMSTGEGVPTERLDIVGTKGRILMDASTVSVTRFYTDIEEYAREAQVTSTQELSETTEIYEFEGFDSAYQIMLQNFADAVLTGAALIAPGEDGSKTLSLVNAAYLSAWQERKVKLPVDMDVYNKLLQEKIDAEKKS